MKQVCVKAAQAVPYRLRLQRPIVTSQVRMAHRDGFVVCLRSAEGALGAGDAAAWPGFGSSSEAIAAEIHRAAQSVVGASFDFAGLQAWSQNCPFAPEVVHAVELALLDLLGQAHDVPVAHLLGEPASVGDRVAVATLVEHAVGAQHAVGQGATALKIKVGARLLEEDILHVGAIRSAVGNEVALRLDANGAWPLPVALRAARLLAAFSPEWLEQPVAPTDVPGLRAVRAAQAVPIAADEAAQSPAGLEAVLKHEAADVIVLKPMFAGGVLRAQRQHHRARAAGVQTVVTHAFESAIGRLGAAHLAMALQCGPACGLSNPLAEDVAAGPNLQDGMCILAPLPGLAVKWHGVGPCQEWNS